MCYNFFLDLLSMLITKGRDLNAQRKKETVWNEKNKNSRHQQRHFTTDSGDHDVFTAEI